MKKALQACVIIFFIIIIMVVIAVYNHVSNRITDEEMLYYKSSEFCSSLLQRNLKSPESYQEQEVFVISEKASEDELKEFVSQKNIKLYQLEYERGNLSLYNFNILIKYGAKKSFDLRNNALCEFRVFNIKNRGFLSPNLEAITAGYERYTKGEMFLLFPGSINTSGLNKFSFWEKLNYLFNKKNFSIAE